MIRTIDSEFLEYCKEEQISPPTDEHIEAWEACRIRCADLCLQHGLIGMARTIMKNEDGSVDEKWWKSHEME